MSRASKLAEQLKRLKGINKPAQELLSKGAAEEQQIAQLMAKLAKESELAKAASGINEPLKVNALEAPLKDLKIVPKTPPVSAHLGEVIPDSAAPQFDNYLGDIVDPHARFKHIQGKTIELPITATSTAEAIDDTTTMNEKLKGFDLSRVGKGGNSGVNSDLSSNGIHIPGSGVKADLSEMNPLAKKWEQAKELAANNKGKLAAATAGGAYLNIGSLNPQDQAMAANTEVTANQPVPKEIVEPVSEEEKELGRQIAKLSTQGTSSIGNKKLDDAKLDTPTVINFDGDSEVSKENLRKAQNRENILNFIANRADSNKYLAYDIAGIARPGELVGGENIRNMAKNQISQYKDQVQMEKEDPNSPQSKGYRELAKSMGFDIQGNASASDLEKLINGPISNTYNQKNAQKARSEENALNRESQLNLMRERMATMKDAKVGAKDLKDRTFLQGLRKEATGGAYGKMFTNYNTAKRMQTSLNQFAQNPSGYSDYATLMGGLKALQGDESVVKEAEIRLGMGATSLVNKAMNYAQQAATGKSLQPSQRAEMVRVINILADTAKNQYVQAVEPLILQAKQEGYDPKYILGEELRSSGAVPSGGPVGASGLDPAARQKRIQELKAKQGIK